MRLTHALPFRALCRWLLAAALVGGVQVANAAYANAVPPPGFGGSSSGGWTFKAANAEQWLTGTVRTNASLSVGGRNVVLPAALRMAANAPRFAATAVFTNPYLVVGAVALGFLWDQWKAAGVEYDSVSGKFIKRETIEDFCWDLEDRGWGCVASPAAYCHA